MRGLRIFRQDQAARFRVFWYLIFLAPILVTVPIGAGYAFSGRNAVYAVQPFRVILDVFPGSFEAHGWILFTLGILLFATWFSMVSGNEYVGWKAAKILLIVLLMYSTWCFVCFMGAMWLNHHYTPIMFWYLALMLVSGALRALPPFNRSKVQR